MLLPIFAHIDAHQSLFIFKHEFRQRLAQLGLAHARWSNEDKGTNRSAWIFQPAACSANRVSYGCHGFGLTDQSFMQPVFHLEQFIFFIFHHLGDGDSSPLVDHFCDVVHIHDLVKFMILFPGIAFLVKFFFNLQSFRFHPGRAFIVALHTRLLFFFQ